MTRLTSDQIARLEARGFRRWTKGDMDRLYASPQAYGVEYEYHRTGSIRTCRAFGATLSNADGYRLKDTKAYVNVADGSVHVRTSTVYGDEIRAAIESALSECTRPLSATEEARATDARRAFVRELRGILGHAMERGAANGASAELMASARERAERAIEAAEAKPLSWWLANQPEARRWLAEH